MADMIFENGSEIHSNDENSAFGLTPFVHPCCSCDGHEESNCCNALIVNHDICSDCNEHTENRCVNCPDKEVEE